MLRLVQREPEARARGPVQERFRRRGEHHRDLRCMWVIDTKRYPLKLVRPPGPRLVEDELFEVQCYAPLPPLLDAAECHFDLGRFDGSCAWRLESRVQRVRSEWRTPFGRHRTRAAALAELLRAHFEIDAATADDWARNGVRVTESRLWLGWCGFAAVASPGPERCPWCDLLHLVRPRRLRFRR